MNTKARMARDAGTLLLSRLAEGVISFVFSAWTVRLVSKEELSLWPVLGLLAGFSASLAGLGLPMAGVRLIPAHLARGERKEAARILRTSLALHASFLFALCVVLVMGSRLVSRLMLKTDDYSVAVAMLAPGMFFGALGTHLGFYLQATGGFRQISINLIVRGLATAIAAPPLYLWLGWKGVPLALALGPFLSSTLALLYLRRLVWGVREFEPAGSLVRFSSSYWGTSLITFAHTNADFLLLGVLTSPKQMAPYFVAYRFIAYLFELSHAALTVASRRVAELQVAGQARVEAAFTKTSRYLFVVLLPVYAGVAGLSWPLITLYAGGKYPQAIAILAALCVYAFMTLFFGMYRLNIWVRARPVETLRLQTVSTILMLGLTAGGVALWGGMGAAVGQTAALVAASLVGWRSLRRLIKIQYDVAALRTATLATAAMLAVVLTPQLLSRHPAAVIAYALCGALTYFCLVAPAIREEDTDLIRGVVPKVAFEPLVGLIRRLGGAKPAQGEPRQATPAQPSRAEGTLDGTTLR